MATTQEEEAAPRTGRPTARLFWGIGGGMTLIAALALMLTALHAPRPVPYQRFVGPPLADGTRYTFLYPAAMRRPQAFSMRRRGAGGKSYQSQIVIVAQAPGVAERMMSGPRPLWLRSWWVRSRSRDAEQVQMFLSDDPAAFPAYSRGEHVTVSKGRYTWREASFAAGPSGEHRVTLADSVSGVKCHLLHIHMGASTRAGFERDDAGIIGSLQVLPLGTSPPSP